MIIPYKQSLTHSCLAACFLMILKTEKGINFDEKVEQNLALNGSKRTYPFYVVGIANEVAEKYHVKINIIADNKYFAEVLDKSFKNQPLVSIKHEKVTLTLIKNLLQNQPLICHIDNSLFDYSHSSHFIVLEEATDKFISIIDPWTGQRKNITDKKLEESINNLKNHIKMCPLLFYIAEK